jgi:hypothetical protein
MVSRMPGVSFKFDFRINPFRCFYFSTFVEKSDDSAGVGVGPPPRIVTLKLASFKLSRSAPSMGPVTRRPENVCKSAIDMT